MDLVQLQSFLNNTAFVVTFVTMLVFWVGIAFRRLPALEEIGTAGMVSGNLVMATLLAARWIDAGYFPLSNLYESLFFLAWGLSTIHLVAERLSRSRLVGCFTAPLILAVVAFAALALPEDMQSAQPLVPALQSNWLMMHVTVMLLSYATLLVGSLLAVAFLLITRGESVQLSGDALGISGYRSRDSRPQALGAAWEATGLRSSGNEGAVAVLDPPIVASPTPLEPQRLNVAEILDNTSYRLIGLGFPLLTIGIIAGAVWANEAWGTYWSWDPKETWALITWLVFAAYLHARITKGWQGRRPALLASLGFGVVWICYLGVNILGKGLHSYGWFF
ncbi:MAG: c-type cytochrome biogenesis protein CcsB [Synechococcaceae cyanobacterium SM2_3_1]|nr:c-type cytochrome biogenesis protein CcsB [Synechococcaceae cyanobacterium SM2_3_1]